MVHTARPAGPRGRYAALAVGGALLCFPSGCAGEAEPAAQAPAAPMVSLVSAAPLAESAAVRASGTVVYKRESPLSFNTPGVVAQIHVDVGDQVRAGQRLANLQLTALSAGAREAAAALETAERALSRAQTLYDRGLAPQSRLDDARLAVERARAGRDATAFSRDTSVLNAPAAGIILQRLAEPAQVVGAGAPILLLGETRSGLIVRVAVSSLAAGQIALQAPARVLVRGAAPEARAGVVERIAPKSEAATGAFDVEVRIADVAGLRSGMVAEVAIAGAEGAPEGPLAVPTLALLDARADQGVVFVVGADMIARRRAIQTAGVVGDQVLVASGLSPGERVVGAGAAFVRDGEPVRAAAAP